MPKTDGQAGRSITPAYDVLGTVGGPGELKTEEGVWLFHDMASVLTQERGACFIRRGVSLAQLQSTDATITLSGLPNNMFHYGALLIAVNLVARLDRLTVNLIAPDGRQMPIFAWNAVAGTFVKGNVSDGDLGTFADILINQISSPLPLIMSGAEQSQQLSDLRVNMTTNAFGAGDLETLALAHVSFSELGGVSSFGIAPPGP